MNDSLKTYVATLTAGQAQTYKNLAMVPLLSGSPHAADYLMLDEALQGGSLEVGEVDTGGSVPELQVTNKGESQVLILDGEELVGAKQNRIVNASMLIAALAKVVIPVSCVEQGRWSYNSEKFSSNERLLCSDIRSQKAAQVHFSLRTNDSYRSDQEKIWYSVSHKARRRNAESDSMAMSEIYEKDRASLDDYLGNFNQAEGQAGAVFFINGALAGLDSFAGPDTFGKVFTKLVKSYALDAVDRAEQKARGSESSDAAAKLLAGIGAASCERRKSVSEGDDLRFESGGVIGFALESGSRILHLAAFAKAADTGQKEGASRMARHSTRQRMRR